MFEYEKYLNEVNKEAHINIKTGKILGASNHIKMIFEMIVEVSKKIELSAEKRIEIINGIIKYYKKERGESSYSIYKALDEVEASINQLDLEGIKTEVIEIIEGFYQKSEIANKKIIDYSTRLLDSHDTILIYDYSSTVEKAVINLTPKTIIIPESRTIDGGLPFIEKIKKSNHNIKFIPDASMLTLLSQVDAVLIGAETYYPDGTAFNTVGSDILAELCNIYKVPYYVLTPTSKEDPRAQFGIFKKEIGADLKDKLTHGWDIPTDGIDFYSIELVGVQPHLITAFITEEGIIPPCSLFSKIKRNEDD